ncbi:MAG: AAA family ATPase, partial [Clostridia bacterium]|nr:AAA family ATPase [Clostridia bacterium]
MRINVLDIKGFGKLKNKKITPDKGFNIIFEPNESGKSTLQAFIKAMLFGLKGGRRAKDGSLPPVKHYKPWSAEQYAGVMEYSLDNGQSFRVGRNFEKGTANIYDAGANNLTTVFAQDKETGPRFAEEHLGLDETTFERSAFIRQLQCPIDDDGRKSLVEKLSNLNTAGSEELSLTKALNALDTALLEKVGTGRTTVRPLDRTNARLVELERQKEQLIALKDQFLDTFRALHDKKELHKKLSLKLETVLKIKDAGLRVRLDELLKESATLSEKSLENKDEIRHVVKALEAISHFERVDDKEAQEAALLLHDIQELETAIAGLQSEITILRNKLEAAKAKLETEEAYKAKTASIDESLKGYAKQDEAKAGTTLQRGQARPHKSLIPSIVGIVLALACFVLFLITSSTTFMIVGFGLTLATAVSLVLAFKPRQQESAKPTSTKNSVQLALEEAGFTSMEDFLDYKESQQKTRNAKESLEQQLREKESQLDTQEGKLNTMGGRLEEILSKAGTQPVDRSRAERVEALLNGRKELGCLRERKAGLEADNRLLSEKEGLVLREASALLGAKLDLPDHLREAISSRGLAAIPSDYEALKNGSTMTDEAIDTLKAQIKQCELEITALETRIENAPSEEELIKVTEEITSLSEKREGLQRAGESLALASTCLLYTS